MNDGADIASAEDAATERFLRFLLEEGLEALAIFRRIRDGRQRELIIEMMRAITDKQPPTDGH